MATEQAGIDSRIAALERQVATLRGALAAVGLAGAAAVALAAWAVARHHETEPTAASTATAPAPTELRVQKLTIVDEADKPRAELGLAADGAVALSMRAPDGALRLTLQAHEGRAGLSTFGDRGATRSWLGWSFAEEQGDRSDLQLLDRGGHLRLHLDASDGVPGMTLYNEGGVQIDALPH